MRVITYLTPFKKAAENTAAGYLLLQKKLLRICFLNFILLSLIGLLLRAFPIFPVPYFSYKKCITCTFPFRIWWMGDAGADFSYPEILSRNMYPFVIPPLEK